jgi:Fe-S cluster assembly ATPase SufC
MAVFGAILAILDETDSGLDIDALKSVAEGVESYAKIEPLFYRHNPLSTIAKYIQPDYVSCPYKGKIVKSGDFGLAWNWNRRATIGLKTEDSQETASVGPSFMKGFPWQLCNLIIESRFY